MISPSLKQKVAIQIFTITLQKNRKFRDLFASKIKDKISKNEGLGKLVATNRLMFNKLEQNIIKQIVINLTTELTQPEDVIIKHFDDTTDMYMISKGEVVVNLIDERKKGIHSKKSLLPGDYFGEISLIYQCKRTAQVVSQKYSTLAKLTNSKFKVIITEYPQLVDLLKEGIYKYNDKTKLFLKKTLEKVEYFNDIGLDAIHDVLYGL